MTQTPAGWYADPTPYDPSQPQDRFWDGQAWTPYVRPSVAQQQSASPPPQYGSPPPMPQHDQPTAPPPHSGTPYGTPTYGGAPYGTPSYGGTPYGTPQYGGTVTAQPTTPDGAPLAGWWQRVGAFVIDIILISILSSIITFPQQMQLQEDMTQLGEELQRETNRPGATPDLGQFFSDYVDILLPLVTVSGLVSFALWGVYSALMLRFRGATLGKMALGIAVRLRDEPGQLPWSAVLVRILVQFGLYLTAVVPYLYFALVWFPLLDVLWAAWDDKRQALHDKAARTNVVRVR